MKIKCQCCGCPIKIEDDQDIRICEECTDCPYYQEGIPVCMQKSKDARRNVLTERKLETD